MEKKTNNSKHQVDNIIFHNIQSLGWEKDDGIEGLHDLEPDELAKMLTICLSTINSTCGLPETLPHNMSQRFRVAAKIAELIKDLGFAGDLGYQSILYSNESDLRKIFLFLIEKLPKDAPALLKQPLSKIALIEQEASCKVSAALERVWLPPICSNAIRNSITNYNDISLVQYGTQHCHGFESDSNFGIKIKHLCSSITEREKSVSEDSIYEEVKGEQFLPTLLNYHSEKLGETLEDYEAIYALEDKMQSEDDHNTTSSSTSHLKKSELPNLFENSLSKKCLKDNTIVEKVMLKSHLLTGSSLKIPMPTSKNEVNFDVAEAKPRNAKEDKTQFVEEEKGCEEKLQDYAEQIALLQQRMGKEADMISKKETKLNKMKNILEEERQKLFDQESKLERLKKVSTIASEPEAHSKLENSLEANKAKEERLLQQWTAFKQPLEQKLQDLKLQVQQQKTEKNEVEAEEKELQKELRSVLDEARKKEMVLVQLTNAAKKDAKKATNRSVYTRQILELSERVFQQKSSVDRVLADTKVIQKEINSLTGKLQRTFSLAEHISFKAASEREGARGVYRNVVALHEQFGHVASITAEAGRVGREAADLQQQVNNEKSKKLEENLKKLEEDLKVLRAEVKIITT